MALEVCVPANLKALKKDELVKLVQDLVAERSRSSREQPAASSTAAARGSGLRPAARAARGQGASGGTPSAKRTSPAAKSSGAVVRPRPLLGASLLSGFRADRKRRLAEHRTKRQQDVEKLRASAPKAQIRVMKGSAKYPRQAGIGSMKITVPVFGDVNDDGSLKKEIALVDRGRYTFPGEMLLKIWTSQPVQKAVLTTQKRRCFGGEVRENKSASSGKYLLRLRKTELVEESSDGFRVTNSFKPWMLTGIQGTPANFKPALPSLFDAHGHFDKPNYFASVREQVGQRAGAAQVV